MKSNTQNAKIEAITEKTLVLGIDVGSETHYARAFDYRGIEYSKKPFKFSNTEAGFATFKEWILDLKERHEKDKVVPGMEPTGHYWFNLGKFLQDNEMKPVLVNPHHVKKTKELDDNNPTKNDRKDPKVIAGLVREGRYMIPYLPEGVYADLRTATNIRFQLQAELTRIQNRISRWFNIYFPEYKTVYGKPDAKSGMLILKAAPLPEDILTLGIDGVNQIWRDAKLRAVGKARAKTLIEAAEHSVGSKEGAVSARMEIRMLLEDYESRNTRLQEVMVLIEELVRKIPMAEKVRKAFEKLNYREQTLLEKRLAICMTCGRVGSWKNRPTFEELAVMFEGSSASGAERAYRKAAEHLTLLLVENGGIHAVRLKQKSKTKRKKKIATAVYEYQADCDGEWGEILFDFENGTGSIVRLADWDTMISNVFAKRVIRYLLNCENDRLPKETMFAFEMYE